MAEIYLVQTLTMLPYILYLDISAISFSLCAWILATHLDQIRNQISNFESLLQTPNVDHLVHSWRVHHMAICCAVEALEQYFQTILLLSIFCICIGVISNSLEVHATLEEKQYRIAAFNLLRIANKLVMLDVVCYCTERLKNQVLYFALFDFEIIFILD